MNLHAEHLGIASRDPLALAAWYQRVLGAQLVWEKATPACMIALPGGFALEFYPAAQLSAPPENTDGGLRHLALRVDAIEPARDALQLRGVQFPDPIKPAGGGGRVLFFRDPEGNLLHLVERQNP